MGRKKTHEEYVDEVLEKNSNIEVLGIYVGANIKILHKCKLDGYEWMATPHNILRGRGCPKCSSHIKRTHEEYVKELAIKNPYVEVIGTYINNQIPIMHRCKIHNIYWNLRPQHALEGVRCKECQKDLLREQRKKSHKEYVDDILKINTDIEIAEQYINAHIPILHRCKVCGYEWMAKPNNILSSKGCPKCAGVLLKSHDEYVKEVSLINHDIEVVGIYSNSKTPILHRCKIDNTMWLSRPDNILQGKGCPVCNESSGERKIRQWLEDNHIEYDFQKKFELCKDIKFLPFDFYLQEYNVCIEYQGEQHYRPVDYFGGEEKFKIQQKHDQIKRDYCKKNNIKLLEIRYDEDIEEKLNNFLFI